MKRLGVSIYMEKADLATNIAYIEKAAKHGFKRIFTCLMSAQGTKEEVISNLGAITDVAHKYDMEVFLDVGPTVLEKYGINIGGSLISLFTGRKMIYSSLGMLVSMESESIKDLLEWKRRS